VLPTVRGKHVAVVALARRLAGILYALLGDGRCSRRAAPLATPTRSPLARCERLTSR
jgi:hypothetical protein